MDRVVLCDEGYTGVNCSEEINQCDDNPCQNGGTCLGGIGNYSCQCVSEILDLRASHSRVYKYAVFIVLVDSFDNVEVYIIVVYLQLAPDPGGSCTASHYDWLAWHGTGLQATGACRLQAPAPPAKCQLKMSSKFKRLVIWRSVFLFFGTRSLVKG